jgi:hypothetical protein
MKFIDFRGRLINLDMVRDIMVYSTAKIRFYFNNDDYIENVFESNEQKMDLVKQLKKQIDKLNGE